VRAARILLVMVLVGSGARTAVADEAPPTAVDMRIGLDLGVASAIGLAGVTYQVAPVHWLRVEGGAGWGPTGTQLSLMPKIALGSHACVFTAGFGASVAIGGVQAEAGHGPTPDTIPWLNLDIPGIECRTRSGFSFQATLGLTMTLVAFHWDLADTGDTIKAGGILPQARTGIGWWF
jgi:hypothetical protein